MNIGTRKLHDVATNPWFITISALSSCASFFWMLYDKLSGVSYIASGTAFAVSTIILILGYIYSIRVRTENITLRGVATVFNEINHIYRDVLREQFSAESPITNSKDLLSSEARVLKSVCQRIKNIYTLALQRECMVTMKLVVKEDGGTCYAHTYVRSIDACNRDNIDRVKYSIGTGENTAFDTSIQKRSDDKPSHFHSADLVKLKKNGGYSNERQHFERYYRSTIVVPIRGLNKNKIGTNAEFDMIGYLCVDTKSINRLNDGYHLQMLSSLAGQMYNFMALMRGKYTVKVGA